MTNRQSVDAWLDRFFRRRAAMANGASTMGSQLDRLKRLSSDSAGREHAPRNESAIPCHDDSASHNAAHATNERLADHTADLLIWASLQEVQRMILTLQREPVMCSGGGSNAVKRSSRDSHGARITLLVCPACELQEPIEANRVMVHVKRVRVERERRLSDVRHGDGVELIERVRGDDDGWWRMAVYEPVQVRNEDIAEALTITERQLRTLVSAARAQIARRLVDDEV